MKKLIQLTIYFVASFAWVACNDNFLDRTNPNATTPETFFTDAASLEEAVNASYATLNLEAMYSRRWVALLDVLADDVASRSGTYIEYDNYTFNVTDDGIFRGYRAWYLVISRANQVIINANDVITDTPEEEAKATRVVGEAKFLRALAHFHLVALWGDIPYKDEETYGTISVPRTPRAQVYDKVEQDLREAIEVLPVSYDDANLGRATQGAAQALLGKVHLYQQEYEVANAQFGAVINNGPYELLPELRAIHDPDASNHAESIFEVQFKDVGQTGFDWSQTGPNGLTSKSPLRARAYHPYEWAHVIADQRVIAAYEPDDPRREAYFYGPTSTVNDEPYDFEQYGWTYRKWLNDNIAEVPGDASGANFIILRLADVYLMHAEALNERGMTSEAAAFLNAVRTRAREGNPAVLPDRDPAEGQDAMREYIRLERYLELGAEAIRRMDLGRWGLLPERIGPSFQQNKHELLPIPRSEIENNDKITENNPGY